MTTLTQKRIAAMERRRERLGLSLLQLCRLARVKHYSLYRWRAGSQQPRADDFDQIMSQVEATLSDRETKLRSELASPTRADTAA